MKKILALVLALAMVLAMAACTPKTPDETTPKGTEPKGTEPKNTDPQDVHTGVWNAVEELRTEEDENSVWQYFFLDPTDGSYNPMMAYIDHTPEGVNCAGWYPWEGSWVGADINQDVADYLELNCEGADGMAAVLGFKAPEDGVYTVTGAVYNPWNQSADLFTVAKEDGTVVTTEDITVLTEVNGYLTPTEVTLKAGELLYFYCLSTSDWVSSYSNITVYLNNTDPSVLVKPEVVIPEPVVEELPQVEGAAYSATGDFTGETADGTWVYAITEDGVTFTLQAMYIEREWDDDPEPDAKEWYMSEEDYVGIGINCDVEGYLEANVSNSFDNGGSAAALGFKAPEDGKYLITVFTQNKWNQNGDHVAVSLNGEEIDTVDFVEEVVEKTIEVELKAGEVVYFYGVSNGDWVSAYLAVFVTAA